MSKISSGISVEIIPDNGAADDMTDQINKTIRKLEKAAFDAGFSMEVKSVTYGHEAYIMLYGLVPNPQPPNPW